MTTERRLRRLALVALGTTILLVAVGGFTRGSGSGYGCEDRWPLCENGYLGGVVPRWEYHMIIEWTHRWLAAIVGLLVLATAVLAWRWRHKGCGRAVVPSVLAVVVVGIQAYVGRLIVQNDLDADLVSVHLAISMAVVGLLAVSTVNAVAPTIGGTQAERAGAGWIWLVGGGAALAFVVLILGSYVHNRYFSGWPLVEGQLVPTGGDSYRIVHYLHRLVAGLGIAYLGYLTVAASRRRRPASEVMLIRAALACYLVNVGLGLVHVLTKVSSSFAVASHLLFAALTWALLVSATAQLRSDQRSPAPAP